jgi:hypothetical protein
MSSKSKNTFEFYPEEFSDYKDQNRSNSVKRPESTASKLFGSSSVQVPSLDLPTSPSKIPQFRRKSSTNADSAKRSISTPKKGLVEESPISSPRVVDLLEANNQNTANTERANTSSPIPIPALATSSSSRPSSYSASRDAFPKSLPVSPRGLTETGSSSRRNSAQYELSTTPPAKRASLTALLSMPSFKINTAIDENEVLMQPKMTRRSSMRQSVVHQSDIGTFATTITVPPEVLTKSPRKSSKNVLEGNQENEAVAASSSFRGSNMNLNSSVNTSVKSNRSRNYSIDFIGVKEFMNRHAKQIKKFEQWAREKNWRKFHTSHFDYWVFPLGDRTNFGLRYSVFEEEVFQFHKDKHFMKSYARGIELVALAWGWNIKESCFVQRPDLKRGQQWSNWPVG